jgi:hypothetical protein
VALFGQNNYKITAKIVGPDQLIVDMADGILLNPDTTLYKGSVVLEGKLLLENVDQAELLLRFTSYEYKDTIIQISNPSFVDLDLGVIQLTPSITEIDGVEIIARKPLYKMDGENLTVNVESSMLASSLNALEILSKSPGIIVSGESISVFGKGTPIIIYNGNQISLDQLASIPSQSIKEIVIDKNPSAKYAAEGQAVIHIILKENNFEGYNGNLDQSVTKAKFLEGNTAFTANFRKKKWSLSSDFTYGYGKGWMNVSTDRNYFQEHGGKMAEYYREEAVDKQNLKYRLGVKYDISPTSYVSSEYNGSNDAFDIGSDATSSFLVNDTVISMTTVEGNTDIRYRKNQINFNYYKLLDTLGSNLFTGVQYTNIAFPQENVVNERIVNGANISNLINKQTSFSNLNLASAQADYAKVFKNGLSMELGGRYSYARTDITRENLQLDNQGNWSEVSNFSNDLNYEEQIQGAYVVLSKRFKKFNSSAGLRAENTIAKGFSYYFNKTYIDTTYLGLFPSLSFSSQKNDFTFNLDLTGKINRVGYTNLDPYITYYDSLYYLSGNPKLIPEFIYNGSFSTTYKQQFTFSLNYSYVNNPLFLMVRPESEGSVISVMQVVNFDKREVYTAGLMVPFNTKKITSFSMVNVSLNKTTSEKYAGNLSKRTPELYLYSNWEFRIYKGFRCELMYQFISGSNDGLRSIRSMQNLAVGVAQTLAKDKLTIRLNVNDIFKTFRYRETQTFIALQTKYEDYTNTQFVRLSVNYKFGKLSDAQYNNKVVGKDELNRL